MAVHQLFVRVHEYILNIFIQLVILRVQIEDLPLRVGMRSVAIGYSDTRGCLRAI